MSDARKSAETFDLAAFAWYKSGCWKVRQIYPKGIYKKDIERVNRFPIALRLLEKRSYLSTLILVSLESEILT